MLKTAKYILIILLFSGCHNPSDNTVNESISLFSQPSIFELDTVKGYTINKLTGDSIKPLITTSGDTIKTGVPVSIITKTVGKEIIQEKVIEGVKADLTIIAENVFSIPGKLPVFPVDTSRLKKVKLGEGDQSFVLKNSFGIVQTGVPILAKGKKMPFSEPHPVKASPMRFKDNATTSIQYLDVGQGLSYSYLYTICEDNKGNLWFGLDGTGISKYDGVNITTYSVKEGLTHNIVTSIIEDRNNNLWIGTQGGISMFDGKNFTQFTEKDGLASNEVLSVMQDKKGVLWFTTVSGVTRYDGKYFINYSRKEGLPWNGVYKCIEDRNGNIWIGTYKGAAKFDGNSFTYYTPEDGLSGYVITTLLEDKNGNIWFGTGGQGLTMFDGKNFTHYTNKEGLSDNYIWSLMEDKNGNIWIGTAGGGLNKFDGKNFTHYKLEQGLSNNKVKSIIEDRGGDLWIATDGGGVNKINTRSFNYRVPEEVVENKRIRPILKDREGNLWLGTEAGNVGKLPAESISGKGKLFTYYRMQDKLSKGQRSLLQDKNGNIWIGTTGSGIIKYDGKHFTNYSLGTNSERQTVYDIHEDQKGNIWFGTADGNIVKYNGSEFVLYETIRGLPGSMIYSIYEDKKGNIWFCTEGAGVYKYDGTNLITYTEKEGLFCKSVLSVTEDENGNIWFGTSGAGVCRFDGKNFIYYSEQQGLADNNVWSVFHDPSGQLWFGTNKGLTLFIPQKDSGEKLKNNYAVYNFGLQDGLKAIDFNLHSVCLDNNNHIWWGTGKNVPSLDLNNKFYADDLRSLGISYIEVNERFYNYRDLSDSIKNKISFSSIAPFNNYPDELKLTYDQNHLTFHFSAIDWTAPDKIKYSYRLPGLESKWSNPSEATMAEYRNLGYGHYQFQVKAIGRSHVWTAPFIYSFTITPAWWQTWWFKTAVVFLALMISVYILWLIYQYRLRKQKIILEKQLAIQYERQRISSEMHDDIGAGLSGVRLLTEMTRNKLKEKGTTEDVDKIYESVGEISAKMKEVIWSLDTENDSISNLVYYIQKQVRSQVENYPGELVFEIPEVIPELKIAGETRRNIYLLVKEAIHNIIKHSDADRIKLTISFNDKMTITISDNGKGMDMMNNNYTGNGIRNMRQRMQQLGGKLSFKNDKGLTLIFEIPLKSVL